MLATSLRPFVVLLCVGCLSSDATSQEERNLRDVPEGLSAADWAVIRAAFEANRYSAFAVEGGYQARNPGQQWLTRFDGRGFSTEPDTGGWTWGLELERYGFAGAQRAVERPERVSAEGGRVAYDWDTTLREWYVNDARGLEHGYTVQERPQQNADGEGGPLTFTLAVRGGLLAEVLSDGHGVRLVNSDGAAVLTYAGLNVFDAGGQVLAARFESLPEGLLLTVDERGARYPLTIDPIAQQAYLKASNTEEGDEFGFSVAVSGDTVVVGAHNESSSATGVNGDQSNNNAFVSGAAYVFVRSGATWSQQAYLKAFNTGIADFFGRSVAVSGDTVVVGAFEEDSSATGVNGDQNSNGAETSGAAYVFVRSGTTWSQEAYLKASNTEASDVFGWSVAVSGDTVVVGAPNEDSNATGVNGDQNNNRAAESGAAYVFVRNGTAWSQQAYFKASNSESFDFFGFSVSVSGDKVVIGAWQEDSNATGVDGDQNNNSVSSAGAAYVFERSGSTWSQQAYLKASNTGTEDYFGRSVTVSDDTVVVGAEGEDSNATGVNGDQSNNSGGGSGAAYVFVRNGTVWSQQAYLKASNTGNFDHFGASVALSDDRVVVGAEGEDSNATGADGDQGNDSADLAGAAYVFVRNGTVWSQQAYLKASNTAAADRFGYSVAMSGETVVVGAYGEDSHSTGVNGNQANNSMDHAGAAYVFRVALALAVDIDKIPLATGGTQTLTLDAGAANAFGLYYLLTTTTGTSPGLVLPPSSLTLPLNFSGLLLFTALNPNLLVQNSLDFLDANGQKSATMTLAAGLDPGLAGVTLHHAYMLLELANFTATFVSNPVPLTLIP